MYVMSNGEGLFEAMFDFLRITKHNDNCIKHSEKWSNQEYYTELCKEISYSSLCYALWKYELELEEEGLVPVG